MPKRKRISSYIRYTVAFRQNFTCTGCNQTLKPGWHLDHLVPLCEFEEDRLEDANDIENMQGMCYDCHLSKTVRENTERAKRLVKKQKT